MTRATTYSPASGAFTVRETDDLRIEGGPSGMPRGLVCRWPDGMPPKAFVLFGHGIGESGLSYADLSRHWASHGYFVVHPTFPDWIEAIAAAHPEIGDLLTGHDPKDWGLFPEIRAKVLALLHQPSSWLERIRIAREVTDSAQAIMAATCGAPDAAIPYAITGHSFGAYLAQLLAGVEIDMADGPTRFGDARYAAAIVLSGQGRDQQGLREGSWDMMQGPVLTVTGTLDGGAKGQDWHWKCEPYELAPPGGKYLAVLQGAAHNLGGIARITPNENDDGQRDAIYQLTLAFLDTHVAGEARAREWLATIGDHVGDCPVLFKRK